MRVRLTVSFELPDGATRQDAAHYVNDAVTTWKGSLCPAGSYGPDDDGDPMFYLDRESVIVKTKGLICANV